MIFYLINKGNKGDITDHNILGEISFNQFHVGIAWGVLKKLVDGNKQSVLEKLDIIDSNGIYWNIDDFLNFLEKYQLIHY